MWKTNLKPAEQAEPIVIHIGKDVVLKLTRRGQSTVSVAIAAPPEMAITRVGTPNRSVVED